MSSKFTKIISTTMSILILCILVACSEEAPAEDSEASEGTENEVYKLTMNSQNAPAVEGTPSHHGTVEFVERVEERTDGRVEIEVYFNNQLAGQSESLEALTRGTIDFQVISPVAWADRIPEGDWGNLPYAFQGEEYLHHLVHETKFGELYTEAFEDYGVKPLHFYHSSAAGYLTTKPIAKPDDFSGVVLSAPSPNISDFYSSMGAGIASVSFADYYESLLRGTIDGVTFPYYSLETYNLSEVVDYITVPGEVDPALASVVVSSSTWDKLPSDIQEIILEVSMEIEQETMEISKEYTKSGVQFARDNGIEVIEMSKEDYNELREISRETYWSKFAEKNERTKEMVDILIDTIEDIEKSDLQPYEKYLENYK
ncbi:TRAP transporter substrate-binding protein [Oceanobacillus longus]|uniref:TRAP transporter substrate-binding protein n=1 Tax=Oceanobacillus longus TaxID=930120 RepID=A0ABV8GYP5_9BACI